MFEFLNDNKKIIFFFIGYFFLWIVIPFIFSESYPLDVPEGIYWGSEWDLGYYKHPPFSSWVLYSFYAAFGYIAPYILSQIFILLTILFIYLLATHIVSKEKAFYSSIFVLAIFYYTWPSIEFNHNVAQMPIWAASIYVFYLILQKNSWRLWLIFGGLIGLGLLTKYSFLILIFSIFVFSLLSSYRVLWLSLKPWLAIFIAIAVFSPNLWWLYQNNWLPFNYIESRSKIITDEYNYLIALKYLFSQVINIFPLIIILLFNKIFSLSIFNLNKAHRLFLFFMGIFPGLLLFFISLILGVKIKVMWAAPMWSLVPLIFISMIPGHVFQNHKNGLIKGLFIWLSLITILTACYLQFGGVIRKKPSRMDWPQQELSMHVQRQWNAISQCKLDNLAGDNWLAILAATKMDDLPSIMMERSAAYTPWMSLQRLEQKGTFILWKKGKPPVVPFLSELYKNNGLVISQGEWKIEWKKVPNKEPLAVQWVMFVPKQCLQKNG